MKRFQMPPELVPKAPPQPTIADRHVRWEYAATSKHDRDVDAQLSRFGRQGWEAYAVTLDNGSYVYHLKRQVSA